MQSNKIIVPNYPPPSLAQYLLPPPTHQNHFEKYKNRLSTFLNQRNATAPTTTHSKRSHTNPIKLSEITAQLHHNYNLIDKVKQDIDALTKNVSSFTEDEFQFNLTKLTKQKDEIVMSISKYNEPDIQAKIIDAIEQRKAKRQRIKLKKAESKEVKCLEAKIRQQKHEQIDKWLEESTKKTAEERRNIETEQRAEQVLFDVHRRKTEAEKYLSLFDSLEELYRLRSKTSTASTSTGGDKSFFSGIKELREMWTATLETYNKEEQQLKDFLNEDSNLNEWQCVLFGSKNSSNDLELNYLISQRRLWDAFIVPHENPFGSSIPIGWVMPNPKPSDQWKQYQKQN